MTDPTVAIIIPCLNEAITITQVVRDFKMALPSATIYVYDNDSTDQTAALAEQAGAIVRHESHRGKGNVVRTSFQEISADIYVLVDGDGTYRASEVQALIEPIMKDRADMVVGNRLAYATDKSLTPLHKIGNKLLVYILNSCFRSHFRDILSGYRAMNKKFVKNIPLLAQEFEVETELTIQALERMYVVEEVPIHYAERPDGSESKIRTFRDGFKILLTIFWILRDYRPMTFFSALASLLFVGSLVAGSVVIIEFVQTGLVLHLPTAVLAVGLMLMAGLTMLTGFVISTINRRFNELDEILKKRNQPSA